MKKQFIYKVYDSSGSFIKTWNDVISEPKFNAYINAGPSEMNISLARSFNTFGEGSDINADNRIDVYVKDIDLASEMKLYSGYISGYSPTVSESKEYIDVTLLPNTSRLSFDILTVSGGVTTQANYFSFDPSDIAKSILDNFTTTASGIVDYTASSVDTTNSLVSYEFNAATYREALDKVLELTPEGWYWRVDADNVYYLKQKSTEADHSLTLGKEIESINIFKNSEEIQNVVLFTGGQLSDGSTLFAQYVNNGSVSQFGRRVVKIQDGRVTDINTAQLIAQKILNTKGALDVRVTLDVIDNNNNSYGYDIESLQVGQTISITEPYKEVIRTKWDQSVWDVDKWDVAREFILAEPLQIRSITYTPDKATIELSSRAPEVSKRIEDIKRNLSDYINKDIKGNPS